MCKINKKNELIVVGEKVYIGLPNGKYATATYKTFTNLHADEAYWYEGSNGYVVATIEGQLIGLHEYIAGKRPGLMVDHKDRDKLNNTDENLRVCTAAENARNTSTARNNKLGIKGIKQDADGKYDIHVWPDNKGRFIGRTSNLLVAKLVYNIVSKWYYGDFAYQHDIPDYELTRDILVEAKEMTDHFATKEANNNREVPHMLGSFYWC